MIKKFGRYKSAFNQKSQLLTGAEAIAIILKRTGTKYVFAYPGTSELVLCNAILRLPGLTLINARGDKEAVFMAAGGSLFTPLRSVAVLHGARGSTNATGAIADARRNEISTMFIVGLPSTSSKKYLPPHGEENLLENIGRFAKHAREITHVAQPSDPLSVQRKRAAEFIKTIEDNIRDARTIPFGPTVIGVPQDALERRWIPLALLKTLKVTLQPPPIDTKKIKEALRLIKSKRKPVIIVDDFLYKDPKAKKFLARFAEHVGAPVLQVWYRRGPMFFESTRFVDNSYFVEYFDINNPDHQRLMRETDLLITLEDRNAYERVIGALPPCPKIAITSHATMTQKNDYLTQDDILIDGDVPQTMRIIVQHLTPNPKKRSDLKRMCAGINKHPISQQIRQPYRRMREAIVKEFASVFAQVDRPIVVDDSQMFGGLLAQYYHLYPRKLRVFGDHGGFIGGGMSIAAGLALCEPKTTVFCTIGDQSFINAIQALASVSQQLPRVIYILCNNGKSVSLTKQMLSQDALAFDRGRNPFLHNIPNLSYTALATAFGLTAYQITCSPNKISAISLRKHLKTTFEKAISANKPVLIELLLPPELEAWEGIWTTKGNEGIKFINSPRL